MKVGMIPIILRVTWATIGPALFRKKVRGKKVEKLRDYVDWIELVNLCNDKLALHKKTSYFLVFM